MATRPGLVGALVIGLTAAKVFLVDMSGLVGLWRVLSFLGLGLALISLGAVYRRFVAGNSPPDSNNDERPRVPGGL